MAGDTPFHGGGQARRADEPDRLPLSFSNPFFNSFAAIPHVTTDLDSWWTLASMPPPIEGRFWYLQELG